MQELIAEQQNKHPSWLFICNNLKITSQSLWWSLTLQGWYLTTLSTKVQYIGLHTCMHLRPCISCMEYPMSKRTSPCCSADKDILFDIKEIVVRVTYCYGAYRCVGLWSQWFRGLFFGRGRRLSRRYNTSCRHVGSLPGLLLSLLTGNLDCFCYHAS